MAPYAYRGIGPDGLSSCAQATLVASVRESFHGPALLEEVGRRWMGHRIITEWLVRVFRIADPCKHEAFFIQVCNKWSPRALCVAAFSVFLRRQFFLNPSSFTVYTYLYVRVVD